MDLLKLGSRFQSSLGHALEGVEQVAVVDFPDHNNVGDSAIWLGEVQALENLGIRIGFVASSYNYSPGRLRAFLENQPSAALLIHGGGNFGGLYRHHEEVRESIFSSFGNRRIVQLPQSVTWVSEQHQLRIAELSRSCADLTLMVRDSRSEKRLDGITAKVVLSPDAAHAISWDRFTGPASPAKILARTDGETTPNDARFKAVEIEVLDWRSDSRRPLMQIVADAALRRGLPLSSAMLRGQVAQYNKKAITRMRDGIQRLGRPTALVTNRLHGMILGLHLGARLYISDNAHGKLTNYVETWSLAKSQPLRSFENLQEASQALLEHLRHGNSDTPF